MKTLLTLFVLFFSFSVVADDVSSIKIEGMSIGDSLLNYFSEEEIRNNQTNYFPHTFIASSFKKHKSFKHYDAVEVYYRDDDNKFIIYLISGVIDYKNNINDCTLKLNAIENNLLSIFKDVKKQSGSQKHRMDKSGKSKWWGTEFYLNSGDSIGVKCFDWSTEMKFIDNLSINISSKYFKDWFEKNIK